MRRCSCTQRSAALLTAAAAASLRSRYLASDTIPAIASPETNAQDVLVVTAPGSGAEIIPFLKTWVNLPMAVGFTIAYAKVCMHDVHADSRRHSNA